MAAQFLGWFLGRKSLALIGPLEGLSHRAIVIVNKRQNLGFQIGHARERTAPEHFAYQD